MAEVRRYLQSPNSSFFLFGPRGTGKTFWLNRYFPDALTINLLRPNVLRQFSAYPERLSELVSGNSDKNQFIIDEIQKLPELLNEIHFLIDKYPEKQFILTGSSARKLKRAGVDLLGGRALNISMHPFMASELGDQFDFSKAIQFGTIPLIWFSKNPRFSLSAYQTLYLREEVQMEALVRNVGQFNRFMESISFSHASLLNYSNISRECEVPRKTVEGFVDILIDLLLGYLLPPFRNVQKRKLISHNKFYFFDCGVYRAFRPKGPGDNRQNTEGPALEGLVLQHLRAWNSYRENQNQLFFWRTQSGTEVDFIVYGDDGITAIEVKNSSVIHPADLVGLKAFSEDNPEAKLLFLYRGEEILLKEKIHCIPCEKFIRELSPGSPLSGLSM
ncbi:MAG: ATPase [Bacteroidetes bacterium RIFCSPLOWO2_02_FULL_36_8]|nr:MAG: ATPase [Bacteroidetes bacterium RIFCSPLOWO2_02_FULL_36_8]OFY70858.1 MAG: ATPase [Bacteroidetes bacterium RIFCSPLOWO2_12_FULL_37_12]